MDRVAAITLVLACFVLWGCTGAGSGDRTATGVTGAPTPGAGGIPVIVSHDEAIFPAGWRVAPISARAEAADEGRGANAVRVIESAMRKYPPGVLAGHVEAVYIVGRLEYSGVVAGGTNSRTKVYVAVDVEDSEEVRRRFSDVNVERVFHAEVSSILLRQNAGLFDEAAWRAVNPPGFTYLGGGTEAIRRGRAGQQARADLLEAGFFREYSQSTLENDFNAFVAFLLTGDDQVWVLADAHERLAAKRRLTIEFLQRVDPLFTEEYLRGLR